MAKTSVSDWDTTRDNNEDIDSIELRQGQMMPGDTDNAFRELMSQVASYTRRGTDIDGTALVSNTLNLDAIDSLLINVTGDTNVITVTLTSGHWRIVRFTANSTGLKPSASLIVNGLTSISSTYIALTADTYVLFEGYGSSVVRATILNIGGQAPQTSGTWTPTDASGGGLSLTASGYYTKNGPAVTWRAKIVYPATADANNATIGGFPFTSANVDAAQGGSISYGTDATAVRFLTDKNATQGKFYNATGGNVTNASLSGDTLWIAGTYHTAT